MFNMKNSSSTYIISEMLMAQPELDSDYVVFYFAVSI